MSDRCVLTLPLVTEKWQEDIINKRMEISRSVYNAMLGYENKKLRALKRDEEYINATNTLYECAKDGKKGSPEYKAAGKRRSELLKEYGFSEFDFVADAIRFSKHFNENLGTSSANISIAKPMWRAFDTMLFGKGDIVHFKKKDCINSVATDGKSGIRMVNEDDKKIMCREKEDKLFISYGLRGYKILKMPIKFNVNNQYEVEMLSMPIKQIRILRRREKGKWKYYVQLCLEGKPAIKFNKETGEIKHPMGAGKVGVYLTTTTVTIATQDRIYSHSLSEGVPDYSEEIATLQQYMDNSKRATNPDNFNEDGTIKKGIMVDGKRRPLRWNHSKRYYKAKARVAELKRIEKVKRELHHHKLANEILALGNDIRVNDYAFAMAAKRSEEDEFKEDGTPASKKRGGKNIGRNAPAMLIDIITTKLSATEEGLITKYKVSNEPDFKATRYDGDKWAAFLVNL